MDNVELSRRLENLIRIGTIAEIDHASARCRIESGRLLTDWLPWFAHRAGNTRTWTPPTIGEQVMIFSPSGEPASGIVLTGIYREAHPAPSASPAKHVMDFPDGARITYDHDTGALTVTGIQTATIQAAVAVTLDTPLTHCTGKLTVDDLLTYGNGLAGTGGDNNNVITGRFTHVGDQLSSNGIVLHTHVHTGVQSGGSTTGGPA